MKNEKIRNELGINEVNEFVSVCYGNKLHQKAIPIRVQEGMICSIF